VSKAVQNKHGTAGIWESSWLQCLKNFYDITRLINWATAIEKEFKDTLNTGCFCT
jgi:hypothetical protein